MLTTPKSSPSELSSASPPDGTNLFLNHEDLQNADDVMDTLSCVTNLMSAAKLRPGMAVPCVEAGHAGWAGSVWKGTYQISTTEPLFLQRVHYVSAYEDELPENIRVDKNGLDGLLAFNEAGHS